MRCSTDPLVLKDLYLNLLKKSLGDFIYDQDAHSADKQTAVKYTDFRTGQKHELKGYAELKQHGLINSQVAHSIIGLTRMNQLQDAVETVLQEEIPGDLIETGVFRGGACILMRGILKAWGETQRKIWVADSFQGFPAEQLRARGVANPEVLNAICPDLASVQENFARYDLLDEQVQFLPGWFAETLPTAPIQQLAVLRLDSDFYESTLEALTFLYPRLAPGGFVIVDDFYAFEECRQAVREYRQQHQITTPLQRVDPVCVYWRKGAA